MTDKILNSRDIDFLLYEFLNTELLLNRQHYAGHSRALFDATLHSVKEVADKYFANHYAKADTHEPVYDGRHVRHVRETKEAWDAVVQLGILNVQQDFDEGGMQLPAIIGLAANLYLSAANIATCSYFLLTAATANLIRCLGSEDQKTLFLPSLIKGECSGTVDLAEAGQWATAAEIKISATLQDDGSYRVKGSKALVTNGDHCLTDNILHMVLASVPGAPEGADGISLFIVPKVLLNNDGSLGEPNEVFLEDLLPKMGCRNSTSTVLNFGINEGAVAYLVGKPYRGLHYASQLMSDSSIRVASGSAALACQGYLYSLSYARKCSFPQLLRPKSSLSKPALMIDSIDVRRRLLTQKSYSEGALALCLYASSLKEDEKTADTECERQRAVVLLDLLTPVVVSWSSKYGYLANDIAIQLFDGADFLRNAPIEIDQFYRDQRFNSFQDGDESLYAFDLLMRKIPLHNQYGFDIFKQELRMTLQRVNLTPTLEGFYTPVNDALERLDKITSKVLQFIEKDQDRGLANASLYLDMFGRVTMAWIWLRQALAACRALDCSLDDGLDEGLDDAKPSMPQGERDFYEGKLQAARFYIEWELPKTIQQAALLSDNNQLFFDMPNQCF